MKASKDWRVVFRQRTGLSGQSLQPQANAPHWPTLTETRPKAKTETRPAARKMACRTAKGQCRNTATLIHRRFHRPYPAHAQPCARGQQAMQTFANARTDGQRPRNLNSGSWPMPRWVHRLKGKMIIFTNRKSAKRLGGFAARVIAAER